MIEYRASSGARLPVRLLAIDGTPVTGMDDSDIEVSLMKSDGTTVADAAIGGFTEITAGAFSGTGFYTLELDGDYVNLQGVFVYAVSCLGAVTYIGVVKVVTWEETDTVSRLGSPAGGSVAVALAAIKDDTSGIDSVITNQDYTNDQIALVQSYHVCKRTIHSEGEYANCEVWTDPEDNVLVVYDLYDADGESTSTNVFSREPRE